MSLRRFVPWIVSFVLLAVVDPTRTDAVATSSDQSALAQLCSAWLINGQADRMAIDRSNTYALVSCHDVHAGGEFVATKQNGVWRELFGSGGEATATDLAKRGVPSNISTYLVNTIESQLHQARGTATGFFPTPPPSVTFYKATGVLLGYGVGMKSGLVKIQPSVGSPIEFYVSTTMTINGKRIMCVLPPSGAYTPPPFLCKDWPTTLLVGKTSVTVTYWKTTRDGMAVNATKQIDY